MSDKKSPNKRPFPEGDNQQQQQQQQQQQLSLASLTAAAAVANAAAVAAATRMQQQQQQQQQQGCNSASASNFKQLPQPINSCNVLHSHNVFICFLFEVPVTNRDLIISAASS